MSHTNSYTYTSRYIEFIIQPHQFDSINRVWNFEYCIKDSHSTLDNPMEYDPADVVAYVCIYYTICFSISCVSIALVSLSPFNNGNILKSCSIRLYFDIAGAPCPKWRFIGSLKLTVDPHKPDIRLQKLRADPENKSQNTETTKYCQRAAGYITAAYCIVWFDKSEKIICLWNNY